MNSQYERLYDSSLLDDIHNYFPALLYDSSRFSSVAEVLSYVQNQTQNRFDLYSYGRNQYQSRNQVSPAPSQRAEVQRVAPSPFLNRVPSVPVYTTNDVFDYVVHTTPANLPNQEELDAQWADIDAIMNTARRSTALDIFGSLLGGLTAPRTRRINPNAMTPVIVRPSVEQIAAGSRLDFVGAITETQCAICQSPYEIGEERRTLSHCNHEFHRTCIDPWFQQNVHCPVCRHDVREHD